MNDHRAAGAAPRPAPTRSELDRLLSKARHTSLSAREHFRAAEALLKEGGPSAVAAAQVHAALAGAHAVLFGSAPVPSARTPAPLRPPARPPALEEGPAADAPALDAARTPLVAGPPIPTGVPDTPRVPRAELDALKASDAAVRALVAERTGRRVPTAMATVDAVRMLVAHLEGARRAVPAVASEERRALTIPLCESCGGRRKGGHYLCRVCWYTLPEVTRARLGKRDPLAYRRLADLQDQLRRDVPLHEIIVREPEETPAARPGPGRPGVTLPSIESSLRPHLEGVTLPGVDPLPIRRALRNEARDRPGPPVS